MKKLRYRYGCMTSGKSADLLILAYSYENKGMNILVLKSSIDTRDKGYIKSRIGLSRECIRFTRDTNLRELVNKYNQQKRIDCVLVDESQFLTVEQVNQLLEVAVLDNINVTCYGLKVDYQGKGFEGSNELLALAHEVTEIPTPCKCGHKATHHLLKVNGEYRFSGEQINIGDTEFEVVCAECYLKEKEKHK